MQPVGALASWPGDYRYVLGDSFLVAPILDDTGVRDVPLPAGSRWIDWWSGAVQAGGTTLTAYDSSDRSRIPMFVKEGAVIPLEVGDASTRLGSLSSAGRLTVLAYPSTVRTRFVLHEVDGLTTELSAVSDATHTTLTLSRAARPLVARIWTESREVTSVEGLTEYATRSAFDAAESGWFRDGMYTWLRAGPGVTQLQLSH